MKKKFYFPIVGLLLLSLSISCSEEGATNPQEGDSGKNPETPEITMATEGEVKNVTISLPEAWKAESTASWCQLSEMSGNGGETVEIVAAYNTTDKPRSAVIYISPLTASKMLTKSDSTSLGQVLRITQPANTNQKKPVCFTELYYDEGKIYFTIYNGRESTSSYQELTAVNGYDMKMSKPYTGSGRPPKEPITYIKSGEYMTIAPYIAWNESGEMKGKFAIAGEQTVNTLVVRQNKIFNRYENLQNEGDVSVHFTAGNMLYYGGGISRKDELAGSDLGNGNTITSDDFWCYNTQTNESQALPSLPAGATAGFVFDNTICIIAEKTLYALNGNSWVPVQNFTDDVWAAQINANNLTLIEDSKTSCYNIAKSNNELVLEIKDEYQHSFELSGNVTTDEKGNIWMMDNEQNSFYSIKDNRLEQTVVPTDSTITNLKFTGVHNGWVYANSDAGMIRCNANQTVELLPMLQYESFDGKYENIGGQIYCFGGLQNTASTGIFVSKQDFTSFMPEDYRPVSLTIIPE